MAFAEQKILNMPEALAYLQRLIRFKSVTPDEAGAMQWLTEQLNRVGFSVDVFQTQGVTNLLASYCFSPGPNVAFCGHIDVVPAKNKGWQCDPFSGAIIDSHIYGRGAADMKGAIAAMLSATEQLLASPQPCRGTFYWLLTSDEEGEAEFGTKLLVQELDKRNIKLDACLVGEPTCSNHIGDTIKNGRRGALSGQLTVLGKAGHVAYPENTVNAVHLMSPLIAQLLDLTWQKDIEGSKTSLQITDLSVPNALDNLVPAVAQLSFNVRYSHAYQSEDIHWLINQAVGAFNLNYQLTWQRPCEPYYTGRSECAPVDYLNLLETCVSQSTGIFPTLSTSGGTSDGRFFTDPDTQVFEFGLRNFSIHQVNERVAVHELAQLTDIYRQFLQGVFCTDIE
ncbi:hypothetical protein PULV_a0194 [Pseudoalteromonas ulvae UL12]|uniref:Succinyl-diaminopimelate desuccinylase n=1 Tax=Pseudoalteromonas ulvae TaxID=107327 RepID=A0A244CUW5_PSEDV|nr:succinyl-diaminopimelate desuccinylase [Pseudoalteromonas ulvae]MBE0362657.1 hypothetical protein [Pseudoalteromonas ulvae UL12]OUL59395.1 succinyl-diaminopimelate desuccinylase [Pseudoalteromonas ulvae]